MKCKSSLTNVPLGYHLRINASKINLAECTHPLGHQNPQEKNRKQPSSCQPSWKHVRCPPIQHLLVLSFVFRNHHLNIFEWSWWTRIRIGHHFWVMTDTFLNPSSSVPCSLSTTGSKRDEGGGTGHECGWVGRAVHHDKFGIRGSLGGA